MFLRTLCHVPRVSWLATLMLGCNRGEHNALAGVALSPSAVAACGSHMVPAVAVASVVVHQRISPLAARDALLRDACWAAEAEVHGLTRRPMVQAALRAHGARTLLTAIHSATERAPRPDELARFRAERWREFDHPAALHVMHAVILAKPEREAAAVLPVDDDALETRLVEATRFVTSPEEFRRAATAALAGASSARIEDLPPFATDGRVLASSGETMESTFVAAAERLSRTGERVGQVLTSFGRHVVFFVEALPAKRVDDHELGLLAQEPLHAERSRHELMQRLQQLREQTSVSMERNVEELTGVLVVPARQP